MHSPLSDLRTPGVEPKNEMKSLVEVEVFLRMATHIGELRIDHRVVKDRIFR